jgi:hypothetical protein
LFEDPLRATADFGVPKFGGGFDGLLVLLWIRPKRAGGRLPLLEIRRT